MQALINITIPGTCHSVRKSALIDDLREILTKAEIFSMIVDTIPGWGSLNQDWVEFQADIETSWDWVEFPTLDKEFQERLRSALIFGALIMMVRIKDPDSGEWVLLY